MILCIIKIKCLNINIVKKAVFQRRNNVGLSLLNESWNLTLKQYWFCADTGKVLFLCYEAQEVIIFILTLKRSVFQRRNNVILSTSKQPQNLTLKTTMIFGLTLKPILFCYTNRVNNRRFLNVYYRYIFDGWKIDASSTCFF